MQFILDNLVATVVAGMIFMIMVGVNHRNQQAVVEATNFYALRKQQLAFVDVLKRDLKNVIRAEDLAQHPSDSTFAFVAWSDSTHTAQSRIEYRQKWVGRRDTVDLYQIRRFEQPVPAGVKTPAGASMPTVTDWKIEARNAVSLPAADTAAVRQFYVVFEVTAPFRSGDTVNRTRWEVSYRPPLIQKSTF
jgi:hypothetical protein